MIKSLSLWVDSNHHIPTGIPANLTTMVVWRTVPRFIHFIVLLVRWADGTTIGAPINTTISARLNSRNVSEIYKYDCEKLATRVYSIIIDEVHPSLTIRRERKIIPLTLVGIEPVTFGLLVQDPRSE